MKGQQALHQGYEFVLLCAHQPKASYDNGLLSQFRSRPIEDKGWECLVWFKVPQPSQTIYSLYPNAVNINETKVTSATMDIHYPKLFVPQEPIHVRFDETVERCKVHRTVPRILDMEKTGNCRLCYLDKKERDLHKNGQLYQVLEIQKLKGQHMSKVLDLMGIDIGEANGNHNK